MLKPRCEQAVVSLSKKHNNHCSVLVESRNGFEYVSDYSNLRISSRMGSNPVRDKKIYSRYSAQLVGSKNGLRVFLPVLHNRIEISSVSTIRVIKGGNSDAQIKEPNIFMSLLKTCRFILGAQRFNI